MIPGADFALEVRSLRKEYPGFTLRDVSFALPRGHIMGLIGPNGAGKTTVIKSILNIVRPTAGKIMIFGSDSLEPERRAKSRIGFVLDEAPHYEYLKLRGIASILGPFYGTWDRVRFDRLCREFDLPPGRRVGTYSRGMKMKLSLAVALAHRADLILLDEPTAGLDPVFRRELLERLSALIQDGRTSVLFSTHITSDLERTADFITCLRDGELVFTDTRDGILEKWALVKGPAEMVDDKAARLLRFIRRGPYGVTAVTDDKASAARLLAGRGGVVERIRLDDLVFYLGKEAHE